MYMCSLRGKLSRYLRELYEDIFSSYLREFYEELVSRYLRGNLAASLRGSFKCFLRRNVFLRFYDEIISSLCYDEIISSLCYDELVRKYALRQTFNDETGFLGTFLVNLLLRRIHEENRPRKSCVFL